jgi:non-ribosomal peptide synthetase component E (peptide arylation enzyme)
MHINVFKIKSINFIHDSTLRVVVHPKNVIDKYVSESWWDNVKLIERFKRNVRIAPDRIAVDPRTKRVDRALLSS